MYVILFLCDLSHSRKVLGLNLSLSVWTDYKRTNQSPPKFKAPSFSAKTKQGALNFMGMNSPLIANLCIRSTSYMSPYCYYIFIMSRWTVCTVCSVYVWASSGCSNSPNRGHLNQRFYCTLPISVNLNVDDVVVFRCTSPLIEDKGPIADLTSGSQLEESREPRHDLCHFR